MTQIPDMNQAEPIPAEAQAEIDRLLASGDLFRYTSEDSPVALLEEEFAAHLGSSYALAVSSCSAALFLSLKALDLPRDARVMLPGFTFAAVPSSVLHAECVPVLCEVGADYRIDMDDFAAKLPGVEAVIISHMRGHTSDMDADHGALRCRGRAGDRGRGAFARHALARTQHRHDRQDRLLQLPELQARQRG